MSVPKLRFPEFLDEGEWEIKEFSKYIVLYRGSSPRPIQSYLSSDSSGVNWIKIGDTKSAKNFVISQVEEKITPDGAKKSRKVNIGELILANSMSYGKTYQLAIDGYIYDGWFVLRDYEKYFDKQFLLQLLNSEYMQNQYERFSAGGIVQNISSDIVYKTVLPHTLLKEQKKIADCLSSIDDRITAETQKLDTLKAHKKGLMQQLFPAEGETLPKLQFPEFRDSGEWEVKKLEEVCDCIVPGRDKPKSFTGDIPWITIPDIQGLKIHSSINKLGLSVHEIKECGAKIVPKNSVIMSCVGTFGLVSICDQDLVINQQLHAWIPSPKVNNYYLAYSLILQKEQMERMATNTTIAYLNKSSCNAITIPLPSLPEQHKIVDCLSFLDEAIAAQSQAINLLKLHKKGLMQQLFPSVEEVKG